MHSSEKIQVWIGSICLILGGFLFPLFPASRVVLCSPAVAPPLFRANLIRAGDHLHRGLLLGCMVLGNLLADLFPLDLLTHLVRRSDRLDVGGLEDLALCEGGYHGSTSRVSTGWGVFPHQTIGHGLSIGMISIGCEFRSQSLHLGRANIRNFRQTSPSHRDELGWS